MKTKKCTKCGITKDISNFYRNKTRKDGHTEECKVCKYIRQKIYRTDSKRERKYNLKKKFNIMPEDFDQMLINQDGKCKICGTKTPRGKGTFHIDHCHKTGKIRGLLCNNCNAILGFANDNPFVLFSALRYLKSH